VTTYSPQSPNAGSITGVKYWLYSLLVFPALTLAAPAHADDIAVLDAWSQTPGGTQQVVEQTGMCDPPNHCETIFYNNNQVPPTDGVQKLDTWINETPGPKIVVGYSLGALVACDWMRQQTSQDQDLRFILVGGSHLPNNSYPITNIVRQYDQWADPPNDLTNTLAVNNILASDEHIRYTAGDLTDPTAVRWQDGNIAEVLIPTKTLPMLAWMGPERAAELDSQYRPIIESAYTGPRPTPAQ
jgi:PE-PPE domain-containing protein